MNAPYTVPKPTIMTELLHRLASPSAIREREQRTVNLAFEHQDKNYVWITDGGTRVGLIDRGECTLEWVAPHPGCPPPLPAEVPEVYHAPTYQGGRIIAQWWLTTRQGYRYLPGAPWRVPWDAEPARGTEQTRKAKPTCNWSFGEESGDRLSFRIDQEFSLPDRPVGRHEFVITYDPVADSYLADVNATLEADDDYILECCNFYAGGVYDNRPARKRHQATIWSHPDGRVVRWPHNPVSYATPGMNAAEGERQIATGGFMGYFADPFSNPVVEIVDSTFPISGATCCNIYDEHLLLVPPADAKIPKQFHTQLRFFSVNANVARAISSQSTLIDFGIQPEHKNPVMTSPSTVGPDLSRRINFNPQFPGFYYGCVNGFEEPIPLEQCVVGIMFFASSNPEHSIFWDKNCGHDSKRSIRLRGDSNAVTTARLCGGPTSHIEPNQAYRLSGWIRCQDIAGTAQIRFEEIAFHANERMAPPHIAGPLTADCEWTYVECTFTTNPSAQFGWLYLDLDGEGLAWFDDVAVEPC